jgi:hypothetical protein
MLNFFQFQLFDAINSNYFGQTNSFTATLRANYGTSYSGNVYPGISYRYSGSSAPQITSIEMTAVSKEARYKIFCKSNSTLKKNLYKVFIVYTGNLKLSYIG